MVGGGAMIEKDGLVLLTRRAIGRYHGGYWEFVSGRLEQGEDFYAGLKREVKEETDLDIEVISPIHVDHFFRGERKIENEIYLITCVCRYVSGKVNLKTDEQDQFAWVDFRKDDLTQYKGLLQDWGEQIETYREFILLPARSWRRRQQSRRS